MTIHLQKIITALLSAMVMTPWLNTSLAAEGDYPTKPISIIVAYAPGGQGDTFARLVSEKLSVIYKQPVVVDNKPALS